MKATVPFLEERFNYFNQLVFECRLPAVPIRLSKASRYMGLCVYRKSRRLGAGTVCTDLSIRINGIVDMEVQELEDVLLHEMIHCYMAYMGWEDSSSHGVLFREWMNRINTTYGRHISISHRCSEQQREQLGNARAGMRIVALVTFCDGRCGIQVLPRVLSSILDYFKVVRAAEGVSGVELYATTNPYFGRYPRSAAYKVYYLEREEAMRCLEGASRLACDAEHIYVLHERTAAP